MRILDADFQRILGMLLALLDDALNLGGFLFGQSDGGLGFGVEDGRGPKLQGSVLKNLPCAYLEDIKLIIQTDSQEGFLPYVDDISEALEELELGE